MPKTREWPTRLETTVNFEGLQCDVYKGVYKRSGSTALYLDDPRTTFPMVEATVEVLGLSETLPAERALLGEYSGGRGLLDALTDADVVEDTGRRMPTAYVELPLVKVLF